MTYWPHVAYEAVEKRGALQHPLELATLLSVLETEMPAVVIEIGTWAGGLTWALTRIPTVCQVITVDLELRPGPHTPEIMAHPRVNSVLGDSTQPGTRQAVAALLPRDGADVLIIDGGHDFRTAKADFLGYRSMVNDRGLIVLHDTQGYPGNAGVQVPPLWAELRRKYPSLEVAATPGGPAGTGILWKGEPR